MKKQFLISLLLIISTCSLIAQHRHICDVPIIKNLRPDTITAYTFKAITIPVNKLPDAKPVSHSSFETPWFSIIWDVQSSNDVTRLIKNNLRYRSYGKEVDSVRIKLFDEEYLGKVYRKKGKLIMMLYMDKSGAQDIPYVSGIRPKRFKKVIDYLKLNFHY